jgi:ankyrin repeat protein
MRQFMDAVAAGDVPAVQAQLSERPSLAGGRGDDGVSAVLTALYRGHQRVVDAIVAAGPDLDVFDLAALGHDHGLEILLGLDPASAMARSGDGFTALHLAAFFGRAEAVRLLVAAGADVDARTEGGATAAELAAARGHDELARGLSR